MKININEYVRVKLTAHGRAVHAADHARRWAQHGRSMPYNPPEEDAEGWSRWQLWALMEAFGPHVGHGAPLCFETEIELRDR